MEKDDISQLIVKWYKVIPLRNSSVLALIQEFDLTFTSLSDPCLNTSRQ